MAPFILSLNHSKRAFVACFGCNNPIWQKWIFVAKAATNAQFECFRCKIKGATENGNFFSRKMVIIKNFFRTQNQLISHSQNTKVAFSQKDIGGKKLYPHFSNWLIVLYLPHVKSQIGIASAI